MKVLVFCPYYPPHVGGLETHSEEFNRYLAERGADIVVFTPNIPENQGGETVSHDHVKIIRYPAVEIVSNYPVPQFWHFEFWRLLRTLSHTDFDIVISRTRFFLSSLLALVYAKSRHIPMVHIEHGSDFVQLSSPFKTLSAKMYDLSFGRLIFRCSDINVSISKAVQKFVRKFDKRESPIIYRGIDFDTIDAILADTFQRKKFSDKIILVTAARLYKWKGIERTIEAIRSLPTELRSKIIYLLIGDGEDFSRLKELSKGLPIEMLGALNRKEVISIFKMSDIYVHSSFPGGGLSTSLLEAMYCNCAVIATPNEGADEIIKHDSNGILIGHAVVDEISKAIARLIRDKEKRRLLSASAQKDIHKLCSWNTSIEKYFNLLETLR